MKYIFYNLINYKIYSCLKPKNKIYIIKYKIILLFYILFYKKTKKEIQKII